MEQYADILLPIALYAENEGSYINMEGRQQQFKAVVNAPGEARPAWKIFRVLADSFGLDGFAYNTVNDISNELQGMLDGTKPGNLGAWQAPAGLTGANGTMHRVTDFPMNSVDPLVRRAAALQQTSDIADGFVHISQQFAAVTGITNGDKLNVVQDNRAVQLPAFIDERLPVHTVLIHAGHPDVQGLGPGSGEISIKRA